MRTSINYLQCIFYYYNTILLEEVISNILLFSQILFHQYRLKQLDHVTIIQVEAILNILIYTQLQFHLNLLKKLYVPIPLVEATLDIILSSQLLLNVHLISTDYVAILQEEAIHNSQLFSQPPFHHLHPLNLGHEIEFQVE